MSTPQSVDIKRDLNQDDLIVITGAGGFIGGSLTSYFHELGYTRIRAIDKKPLPYWYQRVPGVECLSMDLSDKDNCTRAVEDVIHVMPVAPRPDGYSPLSEKHLDPEWIRRLSQSGKDCFDAILGKDARGLGASMNECMQCWEAIPPNTVRHATLSIDLISILRYYQSRYAGAMYSGCGGDYLYVVSEEPVPGSIRVKIRVKE